jgi:hypothetical protein
VVAHDADEVYAIATGVIGKIPGVRKTTTSIVPLTLKDIHEWRIPVSKCIELPDNNLKQISSESIPEQSPASGLKRETGANNVYLFKAWTLNRGRSS